jgi:hypothetical protein
MNGILISFNFNYLCYNYNRNIFIGGIEAAYLNFTTFAYLQL